MLVQKTEKFVKEVNELKDLVTEQFTNVILEESTDISAIVMYKKMFNLSNSSMGIMVEQAKIIDDINNKLDLLLTKMES